MALGSRIDIFRLESGNTYRIVGSQKGTDLFNYLHDDTGETRTYIMMQPSIFPQQYPPKVKNFEAVKTYKRPQAPAAPRKWMAIVQGDNGFTLGLGGPLPDDDRKRVQHGIKLAAMERAVSGASKNDMLSKWTGLGAVTVCGIAVVLTIVVVLIALQGYFSSGEELPPPDPAPPAVEETIPEVTPTPNPALEAWQNPRPSPGEEKDA